MTVTSAHLAELPDDKRQVLEAWLVEFDLTWDEGRLAWWVRRLPPRGDCLRRPALVEMIKIDLERRWQHGQRARLEAYLKALPELAAPGPLPADLLLAEYRARQQYGAPADLAELARRFPRQADELRRLVHLAGGEAPRASQPTPRPAGQGTDAHEDTSVPGLPSPSPSGGGAPDLLTPVPGRPPRPGGRPAGSGAGPLPERLGRYRILRALGRGAMGAVYLAHDGHLDRPVALKVPLFTAADGPDVRQRFLREARAAATIEHPNVCPVYDVGEIDGTPYLTMSYLPGQPLARLLEGPTPMPLPQAASLVHRLTGALQAAHERGIIHRDLKPSNVLITPRGEPVVVDFGLARRLRPNEVRLTQTGQPLGTPAYMAPEQVAGAAGGMGPGCDIYALGVLLYQLLTGRLPFEGSMAEVLGQIVTQPPLPPSKRRPDLDPALEAVCLKALNKKVEDRFASMRDFGAALADYLHCDPQPAAMRIDRGPAATTPPADPGARPRPARLGRKTFCLLLAGGPAAAVLLTCVLFGAARPPGTLRLQLEGPPAEVEVRVDGEPVESAAVAQPLRLPPGKHHLLVTGATIEPVSTSFTVAPGDNPLLRVQLVPRADLTADPVPRRRHREDHDSRRRNREDDDDD